MFNLVSWLGWTFTRSMLLAQTLEDEVDEISDIFAEITAYRVIQGIIIIVSAYAGIYVAEKLINWLEKKVPLRFRLGIKESLPFLRAFIVGLAGVLLVNIFLDLSPNEALALTGTAAVALGFAFKDYASSLIAGIVALFEGPYQVGDRVKIDEYYGEIISYGLRGILVQTPDDDIVNYPSPRRAGLSSSPPAISQDNQEPPGAFTLHPTKAITFEPFSSASPHQPQSLLLHLNFLFVLIPMCRQQLQVCEV